MAKKVFEWRKRDVVDVEVVFNTEKKVLLYFYWNIFSKKNSKRVFRNIVLPSENYVEWHRRITEKLANVKWNYNTFPCKVTIDFVAWNKVKWDVDNACTSIFDTLTDVWLFPDDNKFIIQELSARNVWYVKNLPITKVAIEPINFKPYDNNRDHKGDDLKECKNIFNI